MLKTVNNLYSDKGAFKLTVAYYQLKADSQNNKYENNAVTWKSL